MKMETVIRSPQDGVIKKLAHKEGVSTIRNLLVNLLLFLKLSAHLTDFLPHRISARLELFLSYLRRSLARRSSHHNGIMKAF